MTTFVGTQSDFAKVLGALVQLSYDALEAYTTAVNRIENGDFKTELRAYREILKKNIKEIDDVLISHNRTIPSGASLKQYLTKGKVALADLVGDDVSIVGALLTTAEDVAEALQRTLHHDDRWMEIEEVIGRALKDAHKHIQWLKETTEFAA